MTEPASPARPTTVLPLRARSAVLLIVVSVLGLVAFCWPLLAAGTAAPAAAHAGDAPWLFVGVIALGVAVVVAELGEGRLDAKAVAVLGVLVAAGSVLRLASGGVTGFSMAFFLLLPAGRVFGPGFGFMAGVLTMFGSALLSAGVGPWLPYQMLAAGWVGLGAGLLPPARGRREVVLLAAYGALAGFAYGVLLNLWFWPFGAGSSDVAFVPGDPLHDNVARFAAFHLTTSLGFDLPRAVGNSTLIVLVGGPVLAALRRVARRAAFGVRPEIESPPGRATAPPLVGSGSVGR